MLFDGSCEAALTVIEEATNGKDDMPKRFFDNCLLNVIYKSGQGQERQRSEITITNVNGYFDLLLEGQVICEGLMPHETIFHYILSHYSLNIQLSSVMKEKYSGLFEKLFQ